MGDLLITVAGEPFRSPDGEAVVSDIQNFAMHH